MPFRFSHAMIATALAFSVAAPQAAARAAPASVTYSSGLNSTQSGEYTVHYNAIPSTLLTPEIATRYGITRSANRALLNISVMKGPRAAEAVAVPARIEAAATNLNGQRQALNLREVRDRGAIYYLGEARIEERDTLDFDLVVTPEDAPSVTVRYRQEFWPDAAPR